MSDNWDFEKEQRIYDKGDAGFVAASDQHLAECFDILKNADEFMLFYVKDGEAASTGKVSTANTGAWANCLNQMSLQMIYDFITKEFE